LSHFYRTFIYILANEIKQLLRSISNVINRKPYGYQWTTGFFGIFHLEEKSGKNRD
jgi:hypothetical protein